MAITIEKRIRAVNTDPWGAWASTTDIPPYTDTDLIQYRVIDDLIETVDITDVTRNVQTLQGVDDKPYVIGDGYFDIIMQTMTTHLNAQLDGGRIEQGPYAEAYIAFGTAALAQAFQFAQKLPTIGVQKEVLEAQKELYIRQKEAFDDNKYQKLFEAQLNYNGMIFQDATDPDVLNVGLEQKVNDVFNRIITSTGSRVDTVTQNEVTEMPEI